MLRSISLLLSLVSLLGAETATSAPAEDAIKERAQGCLEVARKGLAVVEQDSDGTEAYQDIWVWSNRVLKAELALRTTKRERIAALEAHLGRALKLEKFAVREYKRGFFTRLYVLEASYRRRDIELQLALEKAKPESPSR